jgi:hypothetical protein
MWNGEGDADAVIEARGLKQITDSGAIERMSTRSSPPTRQVAQYRAGKDKVFGFFVGQVMKASQGQGQPPAGQRPLEGEAQGLILAGAGRAAPRRPTSDEAPSATGGRIRRPRRPNP